MDTIENMKLCRDCRHCVPQTSRPFIRVKVDYEYAKCARVGVSRVDGKPMRYCSTVRAPWPEAETVCGPDAKWFEPIEQKDAA